MFSMWEFHSLVQDVPQPSVVSGQQVNTDAMVNIMKTIIVATGQFLVRSKDWALMSLLQRAINSLVMFFFLDPSFKTL